MLCHLERLLHPDGQIALLNDSALDIAPAPAMQPRRYNGVKVIGDFSHLEVLIATGRIDEVIISTRKLERVRRQKLADACRKRRVKLSQLRIVLEPLPEAIVASQRHAPVAAAIEPRQLSG